MIRVGDLDAALDFFCDTLGFIESSRKESEKGRFTLVFLVAPLDQALATETKAPMLELTYNWDGDALGEGSRNFGHLAYAVEDIYATCARLQEHGVLISRPPRDGRMAFVRSPDRISIELLQDGDPLPPAEPWASMENSGDW